MRFVPTRYLKEGMKVGRAVFGRNGELLLSSGVPITDSNIRRIKILNLNGIYVDDKLTHDIELKDVVSDALRQKSARAVKDMFISLENGRNFSDDKMVSMAELVDEIMNSVLSNRNVMVNLTDVRAFDDYTYHHSVSVCVLALLVGTVMGLNRNKLYQLGISSILHDIGKIFIPKEILNKPGKLTESEMEVMQSHSLQGYEFIKNKFDFSASTYITILQHHERFNGTGYPMGKKGDELLLSSRILMVADVYDALVSDRPYRRAVLPSEAIEFLMGSANDMFDPDVVKRFIIKVAPYPVGTAVTLSNGYKGIVIKNYSECSLRPMIRIVSEDERELSPFDINLKEDRNYLNVVITGIADI